MQMTISPIVFSALYCKFKACAIVLGFSRSGHILLHNYKLTMDVPFGVPMSVCPLFLVFPFILKSSSS